ncbi:alginate export family protein [Luteolibacter soli]|uniref:Alginate export family protein n=1 Tax=Luteolibacter soli TaxID=3135280 RepID=A0ABU9B363_9BACT
MPPASAGVVGDGWEFSIDGNARTVVESYHNLYFDITGEGDDSWVHQRVQALMELEYGNTFKIGSELTWGDMWGRQSKLGPPDQDGGDFLQLFAQGRFVTGEGDSLLIKAGRQTLRYGSARLLSTREGANQRLAHDAFLLSWERPEQFRIDAFVAAPVTTTPGLFDNRSHPDQTFFWSIYAVLPSPWQQESHYDLYYIGLSDKESVFVPGGRELRHTVGVRWWDDTCPWICNTETTLQFGHAGERDILAGALSLGVGRVLDAPMKPTLMLRADAISGGDDKGALNTLHPLFQANNYFNQGGFISPSNLYNLNPQIMLQPRADVGVTLGVNFQWRFSDDDAIYAPPLRPIGKPSPGVDKYLGTAFNAAVTWDACESTQLALSFTHHEAGPSLIAAGGKNVDYLQTALNLRF